MAHLYYTDFSASDLEAGATLGVGGDEGKHAVRVARLRPGEQILVGNGVGDIAECEVTETESSAFVCVVRALWHEQPSRPSLTLVQALAKGGRDERAVEQATEFGVAEIVPWQADRSVSRWNSPDKGAKGQARWQKIAREAAKQSLRGWIPPVTAVCGSPELTRWVDAFLRGSGDGEETAAVCVLDPQATQQLSAYARGLLHASAPVAKIALIVGPEGGVHPEEREALVQAGACPVRLGREVLRTSSAGPAALAMLHTVCGTW